MTPHGLLLSSDVFYVAESYAKGRYAECDYPSVQTIHVRDPRGKLHIFRVQAVPDVTFETTRVDAITPEPKP